jgi:hypothetical protein
MKIKIKPISRLFKKMKKTPRIGKKLEILIKYEN